MSFLFETTSIENTQSTGPFDPIGTDNWKAIMLADQKRQELAWECSDPQEQYEMLYGELLGDFWQAAGLDKLGIWSWEVLDALGMDDLDGPEYYDPTALLYPSLMDGYTVNVWGCGQTTPTKVQGNDLFDVLKAANAAITEPFEDGVVQMIKVDYEAEVITFVCD